MRVQARLDHLSMPFYFNAIFTLTVLTLYQIGYIGPHLPFNDNILEDIINNNPALLEIGEQERIFLTILANYLKVHPHHQSVWVIYQLTGTFMRWVANQEHLEQIYSLYIIAWEQKRNVTRYNCKQIEDGIDHEYNHYRKLAKIENGSNHEYKRKRILINTIVVCVFKNEIEEILISLSGKMRCNCIQLNIKQAQAFKGS
jgi:hypothetical protein